MFYSILLGSFKVFFYLCKDFPLENFSGKYLVGKKKVSTFATANEKQASSDEADGLFVSEIKERVL